MLYVCELQLLVVTDFGVSRKHKGVRKMINFIIFIACVDIGMAIALWFGDKGGRT